MIFRMIRLAALGLLAMSCEKKQQIETPTQATNTLEKHCRDAIGQPRILDVSQRISVAIGYDLANTIMIRTSVGHIIVDTGISPTTSALMRQKLLAKYPGEIAAVIYTHSHIDHVGGASNWVETNTQIWAHANFTENFLKHYGLFQPIQKKRAMHQFAYGIDFAAIPCSAIGKNPDISQAMQSGARLPTHTFEHKKSLSFGNTNIELVYAPGETTDQLYVWVAEDRALLSGDNIYKAFPNLYTIRGTPPRPIDKWISSLDDMRMRRPEHLVPSHTVPISGQDAVSKTLVTYRDGIQWVHDQTVRLTNDGKSPEQIVDAVRLPKHLSSEPYLQEFYGQVDWSVRSIFGNNMGWFGGNPANLAHLSHHETAQREIELMGGTKKVLRKAHKAQASGDYKWALHLAAKIDASNLATAKEQDDLKTLLGTLYSVAGMNTNNTNSRGYFLRAAAELQDNAQETPKHPDPMEETLSEIPLRIFFQGLATRLIPEKSIDIYESVVFTFPDEKKTFTLTIRQGIAEVSEDLTLPNTPNPVAKITMDADIWRELAIKKRSFPMTYASGDISLEGSFTSFLSFMSRFDRG